MDSHLNSHLRQFSVNSVDLHPWRNALVKTDQSGNFIAGIINSTANVVKVPRNSYYGDLHLTCSTKEALRFPWRSTIMTVQDETKHKESANTDSLKLPNFMKAPTTKLNSKERS